MQVFNGVNGYYGVLTFIYFICHLVLQENVCSNYVLLPIVTKGKRIHYGTCYVCDCFNVSTLYPELRPSSRIRYNHFFLHIIFLKSTYKDKLFVF